eukprot:562024-Pyramimonas_sp.AAC.1
MASNMAPGGAPELQRERREGTAGTPRRASARMRPRTAPCEFARHPTSPRGPPPCPHRAPRGPRDDPEKSK